MSSKKQRKEKQRSRINQDKLRGMKRTLSEKGISPFELESWMGHSSGTFYRLDVVYDALEFEGDVENINIPGRDIGCPTETTIIAFNDNYVQYIVDGKTHTAKTSSYLVKAEG